MHCTEHDQDLFLLQHGELSPWRTFWMTRHMRSCPHCQEKQTEFKRVSRLVAGAIRQDAGMPPYMFRGEATPVPTLAPSRQIVFSPSPRAFRPVFVGVVSIIAAMIAAAAYAYKAVALTPMAEGDVMSLAPLQAKTGFSLKQSRAATDASGKPTIFPYSTPNMHDDCPR